MRITEKQKLMLFTIALDSLGIQSTLFGLVREDRIKLCDEIVNQQDSNLNNGVESIKCAD